MLGRCSLPPAGRRPRERSQTSSVQTTRYWRAPSVSATARYSEDYNSGVVREEGERLGDSRIPPSHYSYLSLRARTPSTDRQQTASKQLRFPKTNLGTSNNLTLLIKPRRKAGDGGESAQDNFLPVEVVAVGGKVTKSPPRESYGVPLYSRRTVKVLPDSEMVRQFEDSWLCLGGLPHRAELLGLLPEAEQETGRHDSESGELLRSECQQFVWECCWNNDPEDWCV